MKDKRIGKQTLRMKSKVSIIATYTVAGSLESAGPLKDYFDICSKDNMHRQKTFEKAECRMMEDSINGVLKKAGLMPESVDFLISSDLLDQIITSNFAALSFPVPYLGIYSACSATSICTALAASLVDGGYAANTVVAVSSHNSTVERQFRFPTEYGSQRPPYSQWTATGSATALIADYGDGPSITHCTIGRVIDTGIVDAYNMGAAMAPAALDTIVQHFEDTSRGPDYYDLILTGDLGRFGLKMLKDLAKDEMNMTLGENCSDCGAILYDEKQGVDSGGSGCACSGLVVFSQIFDKLMKKELNKVLVVATGALHSPTSAHQGESIPAIAHAVALERGE